MPPRHPTIALALGLCRRALEQAPGGDVVVACSGGADSIALLGLLHLIARSDGLTLSACHVDHGLREESAAEAQLVRDVAGRLGIDVAVRCLELECGPGLAERAREARRRVLVEEAAQRGASVVALGHTATDQAETVLMHLIRGAGLDGLAGMRVCSPWPASAGAFLRPLLGLTREETRQLAQRLELPFCNDPTNDDENSPRVVIRKRVLPILRGLRDGAEHAIAAAAEIAAHADAALHDRVAQEIAAREVADAPGRYSTQGLAQLPAALRRRFVRTVCLRAGLPLDAVGRKIVEAIDRALTTGDAVDRGWELQHRHRLRWAGEQLWVETVPSEPQL